MTRNISTGFIIGAVVIAIGVLLLLGNFEVFDVGEALLWIPSLFILLGLWLLIKSRFRRVGGPILMIVVAALVQAMVLGVDWWSRFWPVILIVVGVAILFRRFRPGRKKRSPRANHTQVIQAPTPVQDSQGPVSVVASEGRATSTDEDTIELSCVMGTVTQQVVSSEFRGGRATVVMGEANIDLRQAAIQQKPAVLEFTAVMGELNLRAPSDWNVLVEDDTTIGEMKDERSVSQPQDGQPDLVLRGSVIMASLKIED